MSQVQPLAQILNLLKIPISVLVGGCAVFSPFFFASDSFLGSLGVLQYREKGKLYFIILVGTIAIWIISTIVTIFASVGFGYLASSSRKKSLNFLTGEEKQILRRYIEGET